MTQIIRRAFVALLLIAGITPAIAQTFPTVPARSVIGRLSTPGTTGPSQAIPFATLTSNLFNSLCTTSGAFPIYNATTANWVCSTAGGTGSAANLSGTFSFSTGGATASTAVAGATAGKMFSGSAGSPVTTGTPSFGISRREAIANIDGQGGQYPALYVESVGNNTMTLPTITQTIAITGAATQNGVGDAVGIYGSATANGGNGRFAYGGFFGANAAVASTSAYALEVATSNNTGSDSTYSSGGTPSTVGANIFTAGANRATAGVVIGNPIVTATFDVGVALRPSSITTAGFRDDSSAVTSLLINGTHTTGIDLTGATISGNPLQSTGFSVNATGQATAARLTASQATLAQVGVTSGTHTALFYTQSSGGVFFGPTTSDPLTFITNNTERGSVAATTADWAFGTSGNQGTLSLYGATSGSLQLRPPAIAGSSVLRFPNGSTDFSATGGTGQFVKQASAGAALTLAAPTVAELAGFGTGVATALAVNVGSAGAFVTFNGAGGTPSSMTATNLSGTAASLTAGAATNTGITDDTTTNATMYPTWVTANTGNLPQKTTSTKLSFNPSTGTLTASLFVGAGGNSTFSVPSGNLGFLAGSASNIVFNVSGAAAGMVFSGNTLYSNPSGINLGGSTIEFGALYLNKYVVTPAPTTKTTGYSIADTDSSLIFNGSGSITLTLQAAASYTGRWLTIKTIAAQTVVSASSNVVPLVGGAASTAILAATAGKWATLQSDGTNWIIMAGN